MRSKICLLAVWVLALPILVGCQGQPQPLFIEVDYSRRTVSTESVTVRDALTAAGVSLGPLDRVNPDLYVETEPGMVIVVTRIEEKFETTRVPVPFERKTVTNEALPTGETRLIQLGVNGEDEITYRVVLENGVEVERTEFSRLPMTEPVDEIIAVGAQGRLEPVPLESTVAFLSAGNAWVMRGTSTARRPLTTEGDLDSRVFELSPDGHWLLYSRRLEGDIETPINQLWMVDTTIVGETPISLPIQGVLSAEWSPSGDQIAYSTAERTPSAPGWRANNDLNLVPLDDVLPPVQEEPVTTTQVISPSTAGVYSWWGTTFHWAPDGRRVAYARPDQIGVADILSQTTTVLAEFTAYQTYSEWVWVPSLAWSPDSRFVAAVLHGPPTASEEPQDSPVFDLWLFAADGTLMARIAEQVGMWTWPAWAPAGIVYGQAVNPLRSVDSRYALYIRDRDGSNPRQLFPVAEEPGVEAPPQVAWSPNGQNLIFVYNGNLYLADVEGNTPRQLTSNNQNSSPRWAAGRSGREAAPLPESTFAITTTAPVTASDVITPADDRR
ncbi:MAG: G5 domain-containing protein [Anaerolineales bacterium]|nr:MAG: G5 domain-containing protein [Anaerolineales bacterium]